MSSMSSQDERAAKIEAAARALLRCSDVCKGDCLESEEIPCRFCRLRAAVDATHPRPTSDAAAVVAAIVAELRDAARGYEARGFVQATIALRGEVGRIEAAHPRPAEPAPRLYTREEVLAYGDRVRFAGLEQMHSPPSDEDLAALLDAVKP